MRACYIRLFFSAFAIGLGYFFFLQARIAWTNYWLLKDAQQGMAVVTKELWSGHNEVGYRYAVGQHEYTGRSYRNWQDSKYSNVQVGGESVVYFSASHPWLSLLYKPRAVVEGLPVLVVAFFVELIAVVTVICPKSKLAFDLSDKETKSKAA